MEVNGISQIKAAIAKAAQAKRDKMERGLKKAALWLQGVSMKIVPVDFGFLKASAFTRSEGWHMNAVVVIVGYTSRYAIYVHENPDAAHGAAFNAKYAKELAAAQKRKSPKGPFRHNRGPEQQYKFLEQPYRENQQALYKIVMYEVAK